MKTVFKIQGENREVFDENEKFSRNIRSNKELSQEEVLELKKHMIHRFRCLDDDGVTYFWGVCNNNSSFLPLDMVGVSYGCTTIQYKNGNGEYETL